MKETNSINNEGVVDERTSLLTSDHQINVNSKNNTQTTSNNRNTAGISWYFAVFLIVNAALGAGLLNFAKAFNNSGGILAATLIHSVT